MEDKEIKETIQLGTEIAVALKNYAEHIAKKDGLTSNEAWKKTKSTLLEFILA